MALTVLFLASCSADKYLPEGGRMLRKNRVAVVMADGSKTPKEVTDAAKNAQQYISQQPNKKVLFVRAKMRLYCSTNPKDSSGWGNFWREQGETPVVYDENAARHSAQQIASLMRSKGCFNSRVDVDTHHCRHNEVEVNYTIHASQRYKIDEVRFRSMQNDINDLLKQWEPNSGIRVGDWYDQSVMDAERQNIADFLLRRGYYYARSSLVHFMVDTTFDSRLLSILVTVRQPETTDNEGHSRRMPLQKYKVDNIYIYPNSNITLDGSRRQFDTLVVPYESRQGLTNYRFIYNTPITPSPRAISRSMYIFSGQTYRPSIVTSTNNGLLDLNNFRFTDISFEPSPASTDTAPLLDARVRLLNASRHKISLSFELTNGSGASGGEDYNFFTSGNIGLGENLSYSNCNLFGGAEQLTVEQSLLIETPKSVFAQREAGFYNIFSSFELGGGVTLNLPEFLLPFTGGIAWQRNKPHTLFTLNTDYLYRTFNMKDAYDGLDTLLHIERIRFSTAFGYNWNQGRDKQHRLFPINVSYTHTITGGEYFDYLALVTQDYRYFAQNYLIFNTSYQFTFSNQRPGVRHNFDYLNVNVETAGNILNLADRAVGLPLGEDKEVDYYQYFRLEGEYKHYFYIGRASTLVLRGLAGVGLPYGHSSELPYERMFYGGGPTTMRAWQIRRLGPGNYPMHLIDMPISMGDIQLVANIEQRFPITGIFEGAVFADIGNVWTLEQIKEIPTSFAVGTGLGLRVNVSFITIRLDLAFPLYDPGYDEGDRWLTQHFQWNKTVVNFGINYPF